MIIYKLHRVSQAVLLAGLLSLLALPPAWAQQKVQVVTRTLAQNWPCPPGLAVRIRAEKATVLVRAWDKPTVQVTLRLSARHPDRAVAEQDLPVAQYRLQQNGKGLDLLNFFELPAGAPAVRSDLRAEFTVFMPAGNPLQVVNAYGQTELADLTGRQSVEQSFGKIILRDLRGTLRVTARYADLTATNVQADFTCEANKSAVLLTELGGSCVVHDFYGSVRVQPAATLRKLSIETDRTEVIISVPQPEQFTYQLSTQQGTLTVPAAYAAARKGSATHGTLAVAGPRPLVRATTTYAPLTLQTQPLPPAPLSVSSVLKP
ncbi:hypothetical protein QMK33_04420 [Hymenobacter sp. H14-R3]|uniref:hypothetical protein n=1 Tax=Hymenobacter sp. H14-R3 TaxID=3046308 RepID=UPI0024B9FEF7|nr:hypothetical protein [Hymenobacter sp. H14-R3]MDJ0364385.1 hypothetical protein [Hymenobacter sp. H14-R3]